MLLFSANMLELYNSKDKYGKMRETCDFSQKANWRSSPYFTMIQHPENHPCR
jgi:hypothetical protein